MRLSVVIPAYNEEDGILDTIAEAKAVLAGLAGVEAWEIVVVDDGSTDRTREILGGIEGIEIVEHPHNAGYGRSLKSGIAAAAHDTIVITDADLTYPFTALPELLALYRKGFDMVVAARGNVQDHESAIMGPFRFVLKWLVEFTSGRRVPDINSGFRVFDKRAVTGYFSHLCDTFSFTTSLTLSYLMTGRFVAYHQISYRGRKGKTKVRLFRDTLRTMQYIVQATTYYNPLKMFILMAAFALIYALAGLVGWWAFGLAGGASMALSGLVLAFLMFSFGLLAVLLKQIMDK